MAYIYDIADTWNAIGTTFKGIALNVTDTASAAGSLLMDLQVGGSSRFSVGKTGLITSGTGSLVSFGGDPGQAASWFVHTSSSFGYRANERMFTNSPIHFNGSSTGAGDLILARDAANTLAQRNGVNAQAFNLYNTYTDASNYERGFMRFVSNVLEIGSEAAGTGATRLVRLLLNGTNNKIEGSTNMVSVWAGGAEYLRVIPGTWSMNSWNGGAGLRIETVSFPGVTNRNGDPIIIDCKGGSGAGTPGYISFKAAKTLASGTTGHTSTEVMRISQNTSDQTVVTITSLPTTNPAVAGQLWNDAGTLKVSAG